jgi:hypothetical protein
MRLAIALGLALAAGLAVAETTEPVVTLKIQLNESNRLIEQEELIAAIRAERRYQRDVWERDEVVRTLPFRLELRGNKNGARVDARGLRLVAVDVELGAGDLRLDLPRKTPAVVLHSTAGALELRVQSQDAPVEFTGPLDKMRLKTQSGAPITR